MNNKPDETTRMLAEVNDALKTRFAGVQAGMARAAGISLPRLNRILRGNLVMTKATYDVLMETRFAPTVQKSEASTIDSERDSIYVRRRTRLREIVDTRYKGVSKRFADAIDLAQPQASGILSGTRNIGEKLARRLELLLALPPGDLDGVRAIADLGQHERHALRRERLKTAVDQMFSGSVAAFSRHMGIAETSVHSMLSGVKGIGERSARLIEKRILLETGSFDRLEEISFPVRAMSPHSDGVEIKLALLLSCLQERPADSKTYALLNAAADIAIERLQRKTSGSDL